MRKRKCFRRKRFLFFGTHQKNAKKIEIVLLIYTRAVKSVIVMVSKG